MCRKLAVLPLLLMAVVGCDDATGPDSDQVALRFAVASHVAATGSNPLIVTGTNGTLQIDRVWLIVDELELKGPDDSCPAENDEPGADREDDEECEFEAGPFLLKLPLTGSSVTLATDEVPPGTYSELDFEVEDVEFEDEDDDDEEGRLNVLFARVRQEAPDWPRRASMLVTGTFTPAGGAPLPFRTFFDAEIELKMLLDPPLVKTADNGSTVTVELDPTSWFRRSDGTVRNLAASDFAATGRLLEFELDIERGFHRARCESDD
jgi:hypothetical protein